MTDSEDRAFEEALRRIRAWQPGDALDLAIEGLTVIPNAIGKLEGLTELRFAGRSNIDTRQWKSASIRSLAPLAGLAQLQSLDCSVTQVTNLAPLTFCTALHELSIEHCRIPSVPNGFWERDTLQTLYAADASLPAVPDEVLSKGFRDNCLPRLRAHLRDAAIDAVRLNDVKLMVLGNGEVGKTQLCRWLRGEPYDEGVPSTHGITVSGIDAPDDEGRLHLWDFGGQDIYHSTHALFLRSRAIFVIAWTPSKESRGTDDGDDRSGNRDYPLAYWFDYVHRFGGADASVIVVQTQCDEPDADAPLATEAIERLKRFERPVDLTSFSARTGRRGAVLRGLIADACRAIDKPRIGRVRARVKERLEALRDRDAAEPDPAKRTYRTLSRAEFERLCTEEGGVTDTGLFLDFLHHCGTVFHRPGLFDDRLILDQAWALEAIYDLFHRDRCLGILRGQRGRFTRGLLDALLWRKRGLGEADQELLIDMMQSCGLCFPHQRSEPGTDADTVYIAPDLLPAERPADVGAEWDERLAGVDESLAFDFLTPALTRSVISTIGASAGLAADYWRDGLYLYDRGLRSRAFIEQRRHGDWSGELHVRCQGGGAETLLDRLVRSIDAEARRIGLEPTRDRERRGPIEEREVDPIGRIDFARERSSKTPRWFVSHARADAERNGSLVDRFCEECRTRERRIRRDEDELGPRESIARFMSELAGGDRVYVFLSRAYLESDYCMTELHGVWQHCRGDPKVFVAHVRVHLGEDVRPRDHEQMLDIKDYWEGLLRRYDGYTTAELTEDMLRTRERIRGFARHTYDILSTLYDHVQFRDEAALFEDITCDDRH